MFRLSIKGTIASIVTHPSFPLWALFVCCSLWLLSEMQVNRWSAMNLEKPLLANAVHTPVVRTVSLMTEAAAAEAAAAEAAAAEAAAAWSAVLAARSSVEAPSTQYSVQAINAFGPTAVSNASVDSYGDVDDERDNEMEVAVEGDLSDAGASRARPWYMEGGSRRPLPAARSRRTGRRLARLWPHEAPDSDRIINQLMFVPPLENAVSSVPLPRRPLKTILLFNHVRFWHSILGGRPELRKDGCPVDTCFVTSSKSDASFADLILFREFFSTPSVVGQKMSRNPRQIWMWYSLESPLVTEQVTPFDVINWTATYRRDSEISIPYARWEYYNDKIKQGTHMNHNYAANKTKKVAWFVSNCAANNKRLEYAVELQKYIQVDIYGICGTLLCEKKRNRECLQMLERDYKFYLSFENANCVDYITEKFFVNGLRTNVLPIVMGARPEDYARNAPYRSYIHVDEFDSARELAAYLHRLDADDDLYNSYFRWKGTGEFINTYFFCRLCAMLHDDFPVKSYRDVNDWWGGPGMCTDGSWRELSKDDSLDNADYKINWKEI